MCLILRSACRAILPFYPLIKVDIIANETRKPIHRFAKAFHFGNNFPIRMHGDPRRVSPAPFGLLRALRRSAEIRRTNRFTRHEVGGAIFVNDLPDFHDIPA